MNGRDLARVRSAGNRSEAITVNIDTFAASYASKHTLILHYTFLHHSIIIIVSASSFAAKAHKQSGKHRGKIHLMSHKR